MPPEDEKWDDDGSDGRAPSPRMSRLDGKKGACDVGMR